MRETERKAQTLEYFYELQSVVKTKIKFGVSREKIVDACLQRFADTLGELEVEKEVNNIVDNYGDYPLIQKIMRSKIVQEADSRDNLILDNATRSIMKITKERIKEVCPKIDLTSKTYTCRFTYNPYTFKQLFKDENGDWNYNQYIPPFWQADTFFSEGGIEIEKEYEIPELYKKFLNHLVENEEDSYNYILDWIANGLQRRNYCILATIGTVGVGKGCLGDIMKVMFGESNYGETGQRILAERFNSQIKNRRLIYCDEVSVKNEVENERLKVLVNNALEVEAKGKDAEQITNYASIYFSSNSMDAIKLDANDRRFSIVNLTDIPLRNVFTVSEIESLTAKENIDKLARYLYYRPVDKQKMLNVFISQRTGEIREAGMAAWHDWLFDEYAADNAGKIIKVDEVSSEVVDKYGSKYRPSRAAFQRLEKQFPKKLKVYKPLIGEKQVWAIQFPKQELK